MMTSRRERKTYVVGDAHYDLVIVGEERIDGIKWFACQCSCGKRYMIRGHGFRRAKSCGCKRRERIGNHSRTHGKTKTAEYHAWSAARERCHNPNNKHYAYYGGRGITMCDEWRFNASAFLEYMGPKPDPSYSLDKIDNDRGYEPGNVRWATMDTQSTNKRSRRTFEYRGEHLSLVEWAEKLGVPYARLTKRVLTSKWSIEDALTIPKFGSPKKAA